MMRNLICLVTICGLTLVAGCSGIAGTWTADASSETTSPIANVTFAENGTFTANADYGGGRSHVISGHYTAKDGQLELDMQGQTRSYEYAVDGDTLTITHMDQPARLNRMKSR